MGKLHFQDKSDSRSHGPSRAFAKLIYSPFEQEDWGGEVVTGWKKRLYASFLPLSLPVIVCMLPYLMVLQLFKSF